MMECTPDSSRCCSVYSVIPAYGNVLFNPTFGQLTVLGGLTGGQDGLDENADAPLRRISAADDGETEGLAAVTLLEDDGVEGG